MNTESEYFLHVMQLHAAKPPYHEHLIHKDLHIAKKILNPGEIQSNKITGSKAVSEFIQ